MPNPFKLRIVTWQFKLVYALAAYAVGLVIVQVVVRVSDFSWLDLILSLILDLAMILYGARIFRSWNEEVAPPRAWWRMTARRRLSKVIGILATVGFAVELIELIFMSVPSKHGIGLANPTFSLPQPGPAVVFYGIIAALYLNSMAHQSKVAPQRVVPAPGEPASSAESSPL